MTILKLDFNPPVISLGNLFITPFGISLTFAGFLYLFLVFRELSDEYSDDDVVSLSLWSLFCFILGGRIGFGVSHFAWWGLNPLVWLGFWRFGGFSFWGGLIGWFLFILFFSKKKSWNAWYILESVLIPLIFFYLLALLGMFFSTANQSYLFHSLLLLPVLLSTRFLKRYRSFSWYPSGRPGFLFLSTLSLFLIFDLIVDFLLSDTLYLNGILKIIILILSLGLIYFLSKEPKGNQRR
jgi:prolipoprotein diacylglyceryltransferase